MVASSTVKCIRYFSSKHSTLKSFATILICILIVNVYLFYKLKTLRLTYQPNSFNAIIAVLKNEITQSKISAGISASTFRHSKTRRCKFGNYSLFISDKIFQIKEDLEPFYYELPVTPSLELKCKKFLQVSKLGHSSSFFKDAKNLDFAHNEVIPLLRTSVVRSVKNAKKGTQLKLLVQFTNNVTAVVKPKWYSYSDIITGESFSGKDRHFGEVVAFYLSILLQLLRVPPSVIRFFDVQDEIIRNSDAELLQTFTFNGNQTCFYGKCKYCISSDPVCTSSRTLETSVIYYLPYTLRMIKHPWARTYKCSSLARWQIDGNYCKAVRKNNFYSQRELFFDLMDIAVFDFLISNGDRHRIEFISSFPIPRIIMLDNGKSFGNPFVDFIDILAPLYQCCQLRNSTWNHLLDLRGGSLTKWLKFLLENSDSAVNLTDLHFNSLNRRLLIVYSTMKYCFQRDGIANVLVS